MTAWHWEGLSTWAQSGGEDKGADLHGRMRLSLTARLALGLPVVPT